MKGCSSSTFAPRNSMQHWHEVVARKWFCRLTKDVRMSNLRPILRRFIRCCIHVLWYDLRWFHYRWPMRPILIWWIVSHINAHTQLNLVQRQPPSSGPWSQPVSCSSFLWKLSHWADMVRDDWILSWQSNVLSTSPYLLSKFHFVWRNHPIFQMHLASTGSRQILHTPF